MKSKALERAGEADRVKCCVQTDRTKDLIPALFFYIHCYPLLKLQIMKWIKKVLGITELIKKQDETNKLLDLIEKNTRQTAELQKRYNDAYHIR